MDEFSWANIQTQFGMYLAFPIGYMYYFGTNLENRFSVHGFWPTQEQSHKIPFEKDELEAEVQRIQENMRRRNEWKAAAAQQAAMSSEQEQQQHNPSIREDMLQQIKGLESKR